MTIFDLKTIIETEYDNYRKSTVSNREFKVDKYTVKFQFDGIILISRNDEDRFHLIASDNKDDEIEKLEDIY